MKRRTWRLASFLLAAVTLFGCLLPGMGTVRAEAAEYHNTYVNTGDQRQDMLGVALGQLGYTEGENNNTKYGTWFGMPYQPWCATFLCWCARQADISTDVLGRSAVASPLPGYFNIPYYSGKSYTPIPGDLFFTKEFNHVGLVYKVEGDSFYTIEGNSNNLGEEDGFYVFTNKRKIDEYYFGVPKYKGGDKAHTYVKGQDAGHPHRTYYKCTTCGDQYYTGYTEFVDGCGSCMPCSCSSYYAGYYICDSSSYYVSIRTGHSSDSERVGAINDDIVVYVHGASSASGWACVSFDGIVGHVDMSQLKRYYPAPKPPALSMKQTEFVVGDEVTLQWDTPANTEYYRLEWYQDGVLKEKKDLTANSFTWKNLKAGAYEARVVAVNKTGETPSETQNFTVRDTFTVSYDLRGGSDGPNSQTQVFGQVLWLSDKIPVRSGCTFLGWTTDPAGKSVVYEPGDSLSSYTDIRLYAIWKDNNATLSQLSIARSPARTMYLREETLDTTGLALKLVYSDGTSHVVKDGYTTSGFQSETLGSCTVMVHYDALSVAYDVQIVTYIPGDIDLNKLVNRDDVIKLLWHISFPDKFPIDTPADFNGDGKVNRDDVIRLLWHVSFPDKFPLAVEEPDITDNPGTEKTEPTVLDDDN